jgi:hypothetical protein
MRFLAFDDFDVRSFAGQRVPNENNLAARGVGECLAAEYEFFHDEREQFFGHNRSMKDDAATLPGDGYFFKKFNDR